MNWQDLIFTLGSWIFIFSLIPTIRGKQKPELSTSVLTTVVLCFFAATYLTLGLILSAVSTAGTALGWGILAVQRYMNDKKGLTVTRKK